MGSKTFKGGVHPYEGKELAKDQPIVEVLPKGDLVYPLSQHIGAPATPVVAVGDKVLKGQKIAEAGGFVSSPIYASASGTVKAIEPHRVALKPTVNCKNGVWRAYISFFEKDVPCEPKWENWFASYTEFQTHYAKIAEAEQCDLFIAGCEMVMTEHRSEEWRNVIAAIRNYYHGPVSYNTDKYQEENVTWWDCVDMISSSGYYPIDQWEQELDRIERVVQKFKKPFFFAEAGCMSRKGSSMVPNNWANQGALRLEEQPDWYRAMFEACAKRSWVNGFAMWEWAPVLPSRSTAARDTSYEICNKPVQEVIKDYYGRDKRK